MKGNTRKKVIASMLILSTLALTMLSTQLVLGYGAVTCTGYVRDTDGNPLANALVRMYDGGYQVSSDYTDSNGYYCVGDMAPSSPYLRVEKTNYVPQTRSVSYSGGTYNFNLKGLWAIIVAGETEERFTRDALGMYNTLVDYYGYTSSHIYLLTPRSTIDGQSVPFDELEMTTSVDEIAANQGSSVGTDGLIYPIPPPPPPDPQPEVSRAKFEWATDQVASRACSGDQVFIYWTGHGKTEMSAGGHDTVSATQFDSYLDDIDCGEMFIFLGPCHSGSFINDLDDEQNRAIYTSCSASQSGYLSSGSTHSLFPWAVYRGLNPTLNADDADTNNNYRVSLHELFDYCVDFVDDNLAWYLSQDPQRWVGNQLNDDYLYVGDQYY